MKLSAVLRIGSGVLALVAAALTPNTRANAQSAGSVGAVNPNATGTPPGGSSRALAVGNAVVRDEVLKTSATGTLHVTLSDRTTLNLGPGTTMTIDRYVYDPASGNGSMRASVRSGLLRYVGGQTSHAGEATVATPVATIGIRGNMAIIAFDPPRGLRVTSLAAGVISVRNRVSEVLITRPGYTVVVASADAPIPEPTRADPAAIQTAFILTTSPPGQRGGATRIPTDAQAARRGLGSAPLPSDAGAPLDYASVLSLQQIIGRNSAQGRQPRRVLPRQQAQPVASDDGRTNPYGDAR